jgi:hypothetical protein
MTRTQHRKYLSELGLVRKHFRTQGLESKACDAKRHEQYKRAVELLNALDIAPHGHAGYLCLHRSNENPETPCTIRIPVRWSSWQ